MIVDTSNVVHDDCLLDRPELSGVILLTKLSVIFIRIYLQSDPKSSVSNIRTRDRAVANTHG